MSLICFTCQLQITDQKCVNADGKLFHVEHFICCACSVKLTGPTYRRKENQIFCDKCFELKFAPQCNGCKQMIIGKHIVVEENDHYHNGCFACSFCTQPFENGEYYKQDQKPFCKTCLAHKMNVVCYKCQELCQGNEIYANDQYWHEECFVCEKCQNPFPNDYVMIDQKCYHIECIGKLCVVCNQDIDIEFYEVENENVVHPNCLEKYDPFKHQQNVMQQIQLEEEKKIDNIQKDNNQFKQYELKSLDRQDLNQIDPSILNPNRPRYSYEVLKKIPPPEGVIQSKKEFYLTDEEFEKVFKMKIKRFLALTEQKRQQYKKLLGL